MTHANVLWNVARRLWGADCLIEAACRRAEHAVGADSPRAEVGIFYGPHNKLRWDGEGWIGTDTNRLWLKSEGFSNNSTVSDGDHEAPYGRSIPHMRYFDAQVASALIWIQVQPVPGQQ